MLREGRLVGPVVGLRYQTPTCSGFTDGEGRFEYRDDEVVTFSVGAVPVGTAPGAERLTVADIVGGVHGDPGRPAGTGPGPANIARFLQALDRSGTSDGSITLRSGTHEPAGDRLAGSGHGPVRPDPQEGIPAAIVDAPGAEPRLGTVVLPSRTPGSTLVAVVAAPLNPLDLVIASGTFHSARHEAPYVPGSECVGVVLDSDRYPIGSWVYAECHASPATPGTFATQVLVADEDLLPLPDGLDPVLTAAVGNSGTAAFMPLIENAALRPGETVLVLGATGAVGKLAIQVARRSGAGHVVGVARDRAALDHLLPLGADAVVELRTGESVEELAARLLAASGPVDVVLDGVYGLPLEAALQVCAPRARVVNIGNPAGATAQVPAGLLRGKQLTLSGFAGLHTPLRDKQPALTWLWSALARDELQVEVRTFPLEELPTMWREQAGSPHAKCVVLPGNADRPRSVPIRPEQTTVTPAPVLPGSAPACDRPASFAGSPDAGESAA
ncbi:zinc-binding alcohol dehydrogenase family protein [Kitasatospora sp. NBC_00240]|uniref:quinone oxidoreductase family protein n=1 Tax=Kitasatospora sp. NBC_00240 TaxID=2903567 RepID=UPI00224E0AE3|nr:zinc-binding alcohol dehydrogenase family protein [Kitasatospora sp. NBC_00240]MCX5214767.1 zinc-binding alcohol dehydrogenase family protein [Kitasatospora sp. NBC_00240]